MWRSMAVIRTFTEQAIGYGAAEVPGNFGVGSILLTRRVTRAAWRARRTWTYVTLPTKGASNGHKIHGEG
jgi:hypothetical protein